MRFGLFDHMDRGHLSPGAQYRERLELIEACERAGFYAYHLAEHHSTPLGLASSPSVFLAAVAARTTRLRLGPLVYTLSIHHPLRLLEEICMLDQLSGGRLDLGVGRGISPIELGFFGVGEDAQQRYEEAYQILLHGLTSPRLNFQGKHYRFDDVPIEVAPVQRPHPPLWYALSRPDTCAFAASQGMNIVGSGTAAQFRTISDRYREEWAQGPRAAMPLPLMGVTRHVLVAPTDAEAMRTASGPYARWLASMKHLWQARGVPFPLNLPDTLPQAVAAGLCLVGAPQTVRAMMAEQIATAGITYLLCRLAFGDMSLEASLQSVALLERDVLPTLCDTVP